MKIKIIKYDGTEIFYNVLSFEFRTNHVSNWIKIKLKESKEIVINDVCVVKTVENDTCEWIKYDYRTIAPKYHDTNNPYWRIPENMDNLKYCPYCGKEIVIK